MGFTVHAGDLETLDVLMDVEPSAMSAMQLSAVHSAVKGISETVGSLPLQIRKTLNDVTTVDRDHYLNPILRHKPNSRQTPVQFYEQIMGS